MEKNKIILSGIAFLIFISIKGCVIMALLIPVN